jgi:hypothetical protein
VQEREHSVKTSEAVSESKDGDGVGAVQRSES